MIVHSCLVVLYVLLFVCLFVFIFICRDVAGKRWRGWGPPPPLPQKHQHRATDPIQQVHKPHLTANLAHRHTDTLTGLFPRALAKTLFD